MKNKINKNYYVSLFTYLLILVLSKSLSATPLSFITLDSETFKLYKSSLQYKEKRKELKAFWKLIENNNQINEFNIEVQTFHSEFSEDPESTSLSRSFLNQRSGLQTSLNYRPYFEKNTALNGLSASLSHLKQYEQYEVGNNLAVAGLPEDENAADIGFGVRYELIQRGENSPIYFNVRSSLRNSQIGFYAALNALNQNYSRYRSLIRSLYVKKCEETSINRSIKRLKKILKSFDLRYKAGSLEKQHLLNIKRSAINLEIQHQSVLNSILSLNGQVETFTEIPKFDINNCFTKDTINSVIKKQVLALKTKQEFKETVIAKQIAAQKELSKIAYRSAKATMKPNLALSLNRQQQTNIFTGRQVTETQAALNLTWSIPEELQKATVAQNRLNLQRNKLIYRYSKLDYQNTRHAFNQEIEGLLQNKDIIFNAIEVSENLLSILDVKKKIGEVDSLSVNQAVESVNRNQISLLSIISRGDSLYTSALFFNDPQVLIRKSK